MFASILLASAIASAQISDPVSTPDPRLNWWKNAKFGMFIHWGLYSVLEGEYAGNPNHAEWIRTTAKIPQSEYNQLLARFNPTKFNATEWASYAKQAGMQYVVITTKHHDGFALFDSKVSDFDVMSTPFKRDIMAELSDAVRRQGIKMGWYHSIMDWNHPDYLPRRDWETTRSSDGANFNSYNNFLNQQVTELLTNYGDISVMWFDGEWESTWNHERGSKLYKLCRSLQDKVLINNRVDVGRQGMAGMSPAGFMGDFGTPEQTIPESGIPGAAWESCLTMNANWGWNRADKNWKSSKELVAMLVDIVSKGGNLLLNIGPKPDGTFPQEAITRLEDIGFWMLENGDAIYGTTASPFKHLNGAKATTKENKLYLFVDNPALAKKIELPGLATEIYSARVLGEDIPVAYSQSAETAVISAYPEKSRLMTVIEVTLADSPVVLNAIEFSGPTSFYKTPHQVVLPELDGYEIRYAFEGEPLNYQSPLYNGGIQLDNSATIRAAYFKNGVQRNKTSSQKFEKLSLIPSLKIPNGKPGLKMDEFLGNWQVLPAFKELTPTKSGTATSFTLDNLTASEFVGRLYSGFFNAEESGLYEFELTSDDGSALTIAGKPLINNDGLHNAITKTGVICLEAGLHRFQLAWFNASGGKELRLKQRFENGAWTEISSDQFFH